MSEIKKKIAYNVVGTLAPLVVGLLVTPYLIAQIGIERFGILSIAWLVVGYFGILDMGLGRALTQKVAERIGAGQTENLGALIWLGVGAATILGILGGVGIAIGADWLAFDFMKVSPGLESELARGFLWIAATIPLVLAATGLIGVLEGQQAYNVTAAIRGPTSIVTFCAPLLAASHSVDLSSIFFSLFAVRALSLLVLVQVVTRRTKAYQGRMIERGELSSLFQYGGWVTLSNVISPMMVYFDRFFIASTISTAVVAYYSTPSDLISKMLYLPLALTGVMFSTFASDWKLRPADVKRRYNKSLLVIAALIIPAVVVILLFAEPLLALWLGSDFAAKSYRIAQILAIGLLFNSLAMVPFAFVQAVGRADMTAKFHLVELPLYLLAIYFFAQQFGLLGVAAAWAARTLIDMTLLHYFAHQRLKKVR